MFIELTKVAYPSNQKILIGIEQIVSVERDGDHTWVYTVGATGNIPVTESYDQIVAALGSIIVRCQPGESET